MKKYYDSMQELVGNTPLLKINEMGVKPGVNVFAKLELLNPAGSVKDRTGRWMVRDAEAKGLLHPGDTIIEATAGNTGLGIAFAALGKGYKVINTLFTDEWYSEKSMQARGVENIPLCFLAKSLENMSLTMRAHHTFNVNNFFHFIFSFLQYFI